MSEIEYAMQTAMLELVQATYLATTRGWSFSFVQYGERSCSIPSRIIAERDGQEVRCETAEDVENLPR